MITLTELSGTASDTDFREPRGILQAIYLEPQKGIHVQIALGSAGLMIRRADAKVALPIEELIKIAAQHCPELISAPNPSTKGD